ncbi:MAG: PepSY-like domain-containing protein [Treponema sp.]|nr:PepSY-like domain-containing protein [Treponema sp.]MBO5483387.1 PepSY-like domain-containing protein [Spirochaetaceae bacterium]
MKKSIIVLLILSVTSFMFADKRISPKKIPQNALDFISEHFPSSRIRHVDIDDDLYEVKLDSGVKIEFNIDGTWEEITGRRGLPTTMLPEAAVEYLLKTYPNVNVVKIEQNYNNFYEVELKNDLEIYFTLSGEIINEKFDM